MYTPIDLNSEENQGKKYINLVQEEKNLYKHINQMLYKSYDPSSEQLTALLLIISNLRECGLNKIINKKNKVITEFLTRTEENQRVFLRLVLSETGKYNIANVSETIDLLMSYFSMIHPASSDNKDQQAYCDYITSILTRCVLSDNLSTIEKMHNLLKKNQTTILITGARTNSIDDREGSKYLERNNIIVKPVLDTIYSSDTERFEQSSFAKGGIYKQGKTNPASKNAQQLSINIAPPDITNFVIGIDEINKEIFPVLLPQYMYIAHEEHHGIRMLRGALRANINHHLPTTLRLSYSKLEEFVNIRAGRKSDAVTSKIYGLPTRLSHHGSDEFSISITGDEPNYQNLNRSIQEMLVIGKKEANLQETAEARLYKKAGMDVDKTITLNPKIKFSPLIMMLFYNDGLDDLNVIQTLIDEYKENNNVIPAKQNPGHLLAQFSYLWDPTLESNQLKKKKLVELFKKNNLGLDAVDDYNHQNFTPLFYAIKAQDTQLVELILIHGNVNNFILKHNEFSILSINILSEAIITANKMLIAIIFSHLKQPENTTILKEILLLPSGTNPLLKAIENHNTPLAMELLEYAETYGFLHEIANDGSIIKDIAKEGILDILKKLISSNVKVMDEWGIEILASVILSKNGVTKDEIIKYLFHYFTPNKIDPFNTASKSGVTLFNYLINIQEIDDNYFEWVLKQINPKHFFAIDEDKENIMHRLINMSIGNNMDNKIKILCEYCENNYIDLSACMRQRNSSGKLPLENYCNEFTNPRLIRYIAEKCDLTNLNLATTPVHKFNFLNIDLSNANLAGSNMSNSYLAGANLTGSDLSSVNLTGADLSKANLVNANLLNANLTKVALDGAIFLNASDLVNMSQLKQRLNHLTKVLDGQTDTLTKIMLINTLVSNIANCVSQIGPVEKEQVYDEVYMHPLFAKDHSRAWGSDIKNLVNSSLSLFSTREIIIETAAQKLFAEIFKPLALTDSKNTGSVKNS